MTRTLIVEDDLLLGQQFQRSLQSANIEARLVRHAGEALVAIDELMPDIIILDMILPIRSGLALLHELQTYDDTAGIPIIICSSEVTSLSLPELEPYGVRRIVDKSTMQPDDLLIAIKAVL